MTENNNTFPNGMMIKAPHANAPDFIKGSISVKKQEFYEWMKTQPPGDWINLDIKVSKAGKMYLAVNTFKPQAQNGGFSQQSTQPQQPQQPPQNEGFNTIDTSFDVNKLDKESGNFPF